MITIIAATSDSLEDVSRYGELLRREQNRLAGAKTYSAQEIRTDVKNLLCED